MRAARLMKEDHRRFPKLDDEKKGIFSLMRVRFEILIGNDGVPSPPSFVVRR